MKRKLELEPSAILKRYAPLLILLLIFASALWLRSFPARFSEIQALDPFFFYRMGLEVMENNWELGMDMMRYHPTGVDTVNYHYLLPIYLPAVIYSILVGLGMNMHYLHFAIMWPAWLGALSVIPMYLLGKEMFKSKKTGLLAAFFLATVPAFITRTSAGFFEKEPLAGPFIIFSVYFFVRAIKRSSWTSGILGGASLAMTSLAWGGVQYIYALFGGFLAFLFLANAVLVLLDYLFSGFENLLSGLNKYIGIDMIKAYAPLMIIGVFVQQPLARKVHLDSISVVIPLLMLGILLIRYLIERFKVVKDDYIQYVIPAILVMLASGFLVGTMFSDSLAGNLKQLTDIMTLSKGVVSTTVAENAPGNWDNVATTTGAGFVSAVIPQLGFLAPFLAVWSFMFLGMALAVYRFFKTNEWMVLFGAFWFFSGVFGVFYFVRLVFLIGPPAALMAGFLVSWVIERVMRFEYVIKAKKMINPLSILLAFFVVLVISINLGSAYAYSLNLGPSICFPRYRSDNPFDVEPCVTIDGNGNEVLAPNQPWYEAFNFMAEDTPEGSSILSWWDFGYWFQARGKRPSIADGGHTGGAYTSTDHQVAGWYVDDTANWDNYTEWFEERDVDYILMDYTLPGKYGAISKIASTGEQIVGMLQFSQKGIEPRGNDSIYIFANGQYEIWLPLSQAGNVAGTPMFLISQNGQYFQKSYINDVCTMSGIVTVGSETPAMPGCVSLSDLGVYYIPPEAEHTIFTDLMFMQGSGSPVEIVFDNTLVKIYKTDRPE